MAGKSRLERLRQGEGGGRPEEAGVDGWRGDEAGEHHRRGRPRSGAGAARLLVCLFAFVFCFANLGLVKIQPASLAEFSLPLPPGPWVL